MATLNEIKNAGLTADPNEQRPGFAEAIPGLIQQFVSGFGQGKKTREETAKGQKDQVDFYNSLRQAGYSKEDAEAKVRKTYEPKQGFLSKVLSKTQTPFQAPTGASKEDLTTQKTQAELDKLKAETENLKKYGTASGAEAQKMKFGKQKILEQIKQGQYFENVAGTQMLRKFKNESELRTYLASASDAKDVDLSDPDIRKAIKSRFNPKFNSALFDFIESLKTKGHTEEEIKADLQAKGINADEYLG